MMTAKGIAASFRAALLSALICATTIVSAFAGEELIAYSRFTDGYWQIWTMVPDGSSKTQVTRSLSDKRSPVWVNGGRQLAFRTNNGRLFLVNRDGNNEHELLAQYQNINNPDFSSRNDEIIFVRFDPQSVDLSDIWKSDIKGQNVEILTKDRILKYQPRFSPDGRKIAFVRADSKRKNHHLWLMNADGSQPQQITEGERPDSQLDTLPAFSPDQEYITFTSNREGKGYDIYLLELKSKKLTPLTRYPGLDTHSSFSQDGSRIVFVSNRSGNQQLWIMNRDGAGAVQVTSGENESIDPAWGR